LERVVTKWDVLSYIMYPQVYLDMEKHHEDYSDVSVLDTPTFFYGLRLGEKIAVEIEKGKTLIIKLISISELQADGTRMLYFELNGIPREVIIKDQAAKNTVEQRQKAEKNNSKHIGALMPGKVLKIMVESGDKVQKGEHLMVTEAMKMETTVQAVEDAVIKDIYVTEGDIIEANDLLIELE